MLFLGTFLVLLLQVEAKVSSGSLQLDSMRTEQFITKFSFSSGVPGSLEASFRTSDTYFDRHQHELRIAMFGEPEWEKFLSMVDDGSLCRDRVKLAVWSKRISPQQRHVKDDFKTYTLKYPVEMKEHSHFTFVVMFDCFLEFYDAHPPSFEYNVTLLNGDSHLPADEEGMWGVHAVLLCILLGFGGIYGFLMFKQLRTSGTVHLIGIFLGTAWLLQTVSVWFEMLHLGRYEFDGKGMRWRHTWLALDFLSEMLQGLAELVISFTLIALASGWTLPTEEGLGGISNGGAGGGGGGKDGKVAGHLAASMKSPIHVLTGKTLVATAFAGGIVFAQITLELLGRRYEEDFNSFHDHEHWPGAMLMLLRCGLAALFAVGISATIRHCPRDAPVSKFLRFLRVVGMAWFLAFPLLVCLSLFVKPTNRHTVVTSGAILGQSSALGLMLHSFLSNSSQYVKVSTVGRMKDVGDVFGSAMKKGKGMMAKGFVKKVAMD